MSFRIAQGGRFSKAAWVLALCATGSCSVLLGDLDALDRGPGAGGSGGGKSGAGGSVGNAGASSAGSGGTSTMSAGTGASGGKSATSGTGGAVGAGGSGGSDGATVLFEGEDPTYLALDLSNNQQIFWTSQTAGTVRKAQLDGSNRALVADTQNQPTSIVVDLISVYWANYAGGNIMSSPLISNSPGLLVNVDTPINVIADGTDVYYGSKNDGTMSAYSLAGGVASTFYNLPAGHVLSALGAGNANIYFADLNVTTLYQRSKGGGSPIILATGVQPFGVIATKSIIYWSSHVTNDVNLVPADGGHQSAPVANNQGGPSALTWDTVYVYWTDYDAGKVMRADLTGTLPAQQLAEGENHPLGIGVDTNYVYWCNQGTGNNDGSVRRLLLPP